MDCQRPSWEVPAGEVEEACWEPGGEGAGRKREERRHDLWYGMI